MGVAGGLPENNRKSTSKMYLYSERTSCAGVGPNVLQKSTYIASARSAQTPTPGHKKTHFKKLLNKIENVLRSCQEMKSVL